METRTEETVRRYVVKCSGRVGELYITDPHIFFIDTPPISDKEQTCPECYHIAKLTQIGEEISDALKDEESSQQNRLPKKRPNADRKRLQKLIEEIGVIELDN